MQRIVFILIFIWVVLAGCGVTKKGQQNIVSDTSVLSSDVVERVLENNLSNRDFFINKGKISTSGETGRISLFFSMKHKAPGIYLISIRSKSGIEAMRVFINEDTVLVNDRINKTLLIGNTHDFERITGIPSELLKVSIGDFFASNSMSDINEKCINNELKVSDYYMGIIIKSTLYCDIGKAKNVRLTTGTANEYISIEYGKHRDDINRVPRSVEIFDFRRKIRIKISIDKYSAPWFGDIDFIPGSGYKIMPLL